MKQSSTSIAYRSFFATATAAALFAAGCGASDDAGDDVGPDGPILAILLSDAKLPYDHAQATLTYDDGTSVVRELDLDDLSFTAPLAHAKVEVELRWQDGLAGRGSTIATLAPDVPVPVTIGRQAIAFTGGYLSAPIAVRDGEQAAVDLMFDNGEVYHPVYPVDWTGLGSIHIPMDDGAIVEVPTYGTWGAPTAAFADHLADYLTVFTDGTLAPLPDDPAFLYAAGIPAELLSQVNATLAELGEDPTFRALDPAAALVAAGGTLALTVEDPDVAAGVPRGVASVRFATASVFLAYDAATADGCGDPLQRCDDPMHQIWARVHQMVEDAIATIERAYRELVRQYGEAVADGDTARAARLQQMMDDLNALEAQLAIVETALAVYEH